MALSRTGAELWPPSLVASTRKFTAFFSPTCRLAMISLPLPSVRPPPPSFSANCASMSSRRFSASHLAPLKAVLVSSPQVSQLECARKARALGLETHQHVDPDRIHRLHVGNAAAPEVALLLNEFV